MSNICGWITLISGIYFIASGLTLNTENFQSALFFKIIPFFLGVGCIFVAIKLFDIIAFK